MTVPTRRREVLEEVTDRVAEVVRGSGVQEGICYVVVPHTTAGVTINEAADPAVAADVLSYLGELIPRQGEWLHAEGNSDAHIKSALVGHSAVVPIEGGELVLGTWQGIYLAEFDGPRARTVLVKIMPG
ncbi:MAG TPA: secondary thiamine-phosphate synthase enzyme YjbQ [Chloroflexota bacterium]|nr:secondary thiamine-phosphate synthase enzyme YjbQ [Chloroflexota bacterium]